MEGFHAEPLNEEKGAEIVAEVIHDAAMSSVNAAEVAGKLVDVKWSVEDVEKLFINLQLDIIPFEISTALITGDMRKATSKYGLSLADRACLATAIQKSLRVLTADGPWRKIKIEGLEIQNIR